MAAPVNDAIPAEEFVTLSEQNYKAFPKIRSLIESTARNALKILYTRIAAHPTTAKLLPNEEIRNHAAGAQFTHWINLYSGKFDANAKARSENIGHVHARVGLSPTFYIGGYALVLEELIKTALNQGIHTRLNGRQLGNVLGTLVKTALLDMEAALSAYFAEEEKNRAAVIHALGDAMAKVADGDLRAQLENLPAAYAKVGEDFHMMRHRISEIITEMSDAADNINTGSNEISAAADDLAIRTEQQAASLAATTEVMGGITEGMITCAANAKQVNHSVSQASIEAGKGGEIVDHAVSAMDKIKTSSVEIAKITEVIEAIAFQTNLLALNAGVATPSSRCAARGGLSGPPPRRPRG
jgi:methyl-accepting chemotaxis protein